MQIKYPSIHSLAYCYCTGLFSSPASINVMRPRLLRKSLEKSITSFNILAEMMEAVNVLWDIRSGEEPELAWCGPEVIDVFLFDREDIVMNGFVCRKKRGLNDAIKSNVEISNPNLNDMLLWKLDDVDQPCNAKVYWCFEGDDMLCCFVTCTLSNQWKV